MRPPRSRARLQRSVALAGLAVVSGVALAPAPVPAIALRADGGLVLSGGRYLDVRAGSLRPNGAIEVRDGRIVALHPPGSGWKPAPDAVVLVLEGRTILPGLIDAHVHLTLSGDPAATAAATLRAGFTTVADLGSAGGVGIRLRDAVAAGRVTGPRIVAAGSWIGARPRSGCASAASG